jgi:hypothetical protein
MSAGRSPNAKGERTVWLEVVWIDRLGTLPGPGESCSDAILRLLGMETAK